MALIDDMNQAVVNANTAAQGTIDVLTGDVDIPVDIGGTSVPSLATRIRDYIQGQGSLNGEDGVGIAELYVDQGFLFVRLDNEPTATNLGSIKPEDGVGVDTVDIDQQTGDLTITLTDGSSFGPTNVTGDNALQITDAFIDNGDLVIRFEDNSVINAGDVTQFGGVSANGADVNVSGELIILFSDGSTENVGPVEGPAGLNGTSTVTGYIDAGGNLSFLRSDGSTYLIQGINPTLVDASSVSVDGARIENGDLILELSGGDYTVGPIVGTDGVDGKSAYELAVDGGFVGTEQDYLDSLQGQDGLGISSLYIENDELKVEYSDSSIVTLGPVVNQIYREPDIIVTEAEIIAGELHIEISVEGAPASSYNVGRVLGKSAYELAVEEGFVGTQAQWIESLNGRDVTRMFIDQDLLKAEYSDGSIESVGPVVANILPDNDIFVTEASITNGQLSLFISVDGQAPQSTVVGRVLGKSAYEIAVEEGFVGTEAQWLASLDGNDGLSVTQLFFENDELKVEFSDASVSTIGPVTNTVNQEADVIVTNAEIDSNGDLLLDISINEAPPTQVNVGRVTGKSAYELAVDGGFVGTEQDYLDSLEGSEFVSATINAQDELVLTDTEANELNAGVIEQVTVTGATVDNGTGFLTLDLSDGSSISTTVDIRGVDGVDGTGVDNAYVDVNGDLWFGFTDGPDLNAGKVTAPVETDATINGQNELTITLSDGQVFNLGSIYGGDGIYLDTAYIDDGDLVFELSDGSPPVRIEMEKNPTAVSITQDGYLQIDFNDATSLVSTERVQAIDGDGITNISESNFNLIIDYTTGNGTGTAQVVIEEVFGRTLTQFDYDGQDTITVDSDLDPEPYDITIPHGIDGDGINGPVIVDQDELIIPITIANRTGTDEVVIPRVKGNSINSITIDGNDNLVINHTNGVETIAPLAGADGNSIETATLGGAEGRDVTLTFTDIPDVVIPGVRGDDGVTIDLIEVTDDGMGNVALEITTSDNPTPLVFPQEKGADATESIISITFDEMSDDLVIEKPLETINVPMVRGKTINSITIQNEDNSQATIDINWTDGVESFTLDKGIDGDTLTGISFDAQADELTITTSLPAPDDVIVIPGVKGADGLDAPAIATAVIDANDDLIITMDDDLGGQQAPTVYTIDGVGAAVVSADIVNRKLELTLSDGSILTTPNDVVGADGNGVGVVGATFINGTLTLQVAGADEVESDVEAGTIDTSSVVNARIDEVAEEGILVLELDNATEITVGNVYGRDGRYVVGVQLVDGDLILDMSDSTQINAGSAVGDQGRTLTSATVQPNGQLIIGYSDASFEDAGNVGQGGGISVWSADDTPYALDAVVIHEGGIYISTLDGNSDEPPSPNWTAFALGDQIVEVRKPFTISPTGGVSAFSVRPTLVGSVYAPIVSADNRGYREFEVDLEAGDFSTPVYTMQVDSDSHVLESDLSLSTDYKWRCRDVSARGYISDWSDPSSFSVPADIVDVPTVTINENEDAMNAVVAPEFETTAYSNQFNAEAHTETDWQIRRTSDGVVVWDSLNDSVNLESIIVPYGNLLGGESYEVRARHRAETIESGWSNWFAFNTVDIQYLEVPLVTFDDVADEFTSTPLAKTAAFEALGTIGVAVESVTWRIHRVSDNALIKEVEKVSDFYQYDLPLDLSANTDYRVTIEIFTDRFGNVVSDGTEFEFLSSVDTPTLSTLEDTMNFPYQGLITASAFSGVNASHISTDWEVRDFNTDELLYSETVSEGDLLNLEMPVAYDGDLKVRVRFNAEFISSEWSNYLSFYTETSDLVFVYGAPNNNNVIEKLTSDGDVLWQYIAENGNVTFLDCDPDGNVIAVLNTDRLLRLNPYGMVLTDITIPVNSNGSPYSVIVDGNGDIIYGDRDGVVYKIDVAGNPIWNTPVIGTNNQARDLAVDASGNVYAAISVSTGDINLKKFDSLGNEVWDYSNPYPNLYTYCCDVALDGNVYIGCSSVQSATVTRIIQVDQNGDEVNSIPLSNTLSDTVYAVRVDSSDNVYFCTSTSPNRVYKYDNMGNEVWTYDPVGPPTALGVTKDDEVFVGTNNSSNRVLKLDSLGGLVWNNGGSTIPFRWMAITPGKYRSPRQAP